MNQSYIKGILNIQALQQTRCYKTLLHKSDFGRHIDDQANTMRLDSDTNKFYLNAY